MVERDPALPPIDALTGAGAGDTIERERVLGAVSEALFGAPARPQQLGRYVLLDKLGEGAMGLVYAAYDPQLDRKVALKVLRRDAFVGDGDQARTRLLREARAMARLTHRHVVTVHEVGEEDGRIYIAMEYIRGGTLRRWIHAEPRSWREVVEVFVRAGEGLAAAHEAGLVHRDFKPENVLLDPEGDARVADFGLARALERDRAENLEATHDPQDPESTREEDVTMTGTGGLAGTPAYMAPEVFAGQPADARADQFSFCVALYEALYRERPFPGETLYTLREAVEGGRVRDAPPRGDVPASLRRLVLRGLAVRPDDRHPNLRSLTAALADQLIPERGRAWLAGGAVLLGLAALGLAAWPRTSAPPEPCGGGEARVEAVWNDARARALIAALGEADPANPASARVRALADTFGSDWASAHRQACLDTAVHKVQSEARLDARMVCLDGRLRAFDGALEALERGTGVPLEGAIRALEALPAIDACADPRHTASGRTAPDRDARLALEEDMARARTLDLSGEPARAGALADELIERASQSGDPWSVAQVRFLAGSIALRSGVVGSASHHLRLALAASERAAADRLRADILIGQSSDAVLSRELPRARAALEHAEAVLDRHGGAPELEALLAGRRGVVAYYEGQYDEAITHYHDSLARLEDLGDRGRRQRTAVLGNLGLALRDVGRLDEALETMQQGRALRVRLYGPRSPSLATDDLNIGMVLDTLARFDEALEVLERGLAVTTEVRGPDSPDAAQIHEGMGVVLGNRGDLESALDHHAEAQRIFAALGQGEHTDMAMSMGNQALCLVLLDRTDEALPLQYRALELWEKNLGADHPDVAYALRDVGFTLIKLDRHEEAVPLLERSMKLRLDHEMPPLLVGDSRYHLALALEPDAPEAALQQARLALADYEAAEGANPELLSNTREVIARLEAR